MNVYRFRMFTGWAYHDLQMLFARYTSWYALYCSETQSTEALEMLSHHRMLRRRLLMLIPVLGPAGPNALLHSITEMARDDALEEMEEEGLSEDLFD